MKYIFYVFFLGSSLLLLNCHSETSPPTEATSTKIKALIIDGENNHGVWPKTSMMMKDYLEQTGLFEVEIERTAYTWQGPHYDKTIGLEDIKTLLTMYPIGNSKTSQSVEEPQPDPDFNPDFGKYDVVISNMGWKASSWPAATKSNFEKYMADAGGLVVVHAANNSWGDWPEYNKMIGLGGWDGRNEASGSFVYYDNEGQLQRNIPDRTCGSHGPQHEFLLETRAPEHPVMKGLPTTWLHAKDELYDRLCGPADNMTMLATAYSDLEHKGSERHEPALFTVDYGKGRVFHTILGHMDYSMECVGFITTFQRGTEWAATGKVSQSLPADFPDAEMVRKRTWKYPGK